VLCTCQVDGVLWRWLYSKDQFAAKVKEWSGGDAFYEAKALSIYGGTFLSAAATRRSILRVARGFAMLEAALADKEAACAETRKGAAVPMEASVGGGGGGHGGGEASPWLVGGAFSQADIAVYPRLVKAPQNGILATASQRKSFPRVLSLFRALRDRKAFAPFKVSGAHR